MNGYVTLAYRLLGPLSEGQSGEKELQKKLNQADFPMRAGAYRAALYLASAIAASMGLVLGILLAVAIPNPPPALRVLLPLAFSLSLGGFVVLLAPVLLQNAATERAKDIDENLSHGLNYMLALANAGLPPREIWSSLSKATVFGALAVEASLIRRDLDLFNQDLIEALRHAQERTPSKRFQEFLQGAISAFQSGVELESYLRNKGAQYQREAMEEQLETIETMGLMAETFLVVVVAAPLFMIILLTVMAIDQGDSVVSWGYMLTLVFTPLCQLIVGALVKSMNPRVWT